jgi:hypothetical protein
MRNRIRRLAFTVATACLLVVAAAGPAGAKWRWS